MNYISGNGINGYSCWMTFIYIVQPELDFFLNKNPKKVIVLLKGKSGTKVYVDFDLSLNFILAYRSCETTM